jgi:hypothetical protein
MLLRSVDAVGQEELEAVKCQSTVESADLNAQGAGKKLRLIDEED